MTDRHDYDRLIPRTWTQSDLSEHRGLWPRRPRLTHPAGEGPAEIDTVVDIIFHHTDATGRTRSRATSPDKLFYVSSRTPPNPALIDARRRLRIRHHVEHRRPGARHLRQRRVLCDRRAGAIRRRDLKSVKWPVDYVVSTLRLLKMKLQSK